MNTLLVVLSLRHLLALRKLWHDSSGSTTDVMDEHSLDEKMIGNGIRASAMLLPLLAVMWFLEVVALENATSIFFQVAAAVANIALVSTFCMPVKYHLDNVYVKLEFNFLSILFEEIHNNHYILVIEKPKIYRHLLRVHKDLADQWKGSVVCGSFSLTCI